jgi:hypothetical protein
MQNKECRIQETGDSNDSDGFIALSVLAFGGEMPDHFGTDHYQFYMERSKRPVLNLHG